MSEAPMQFTVQHKESVHFPNYQARDWEVVDYEFYELEGTGLKFRGPAAESLSPGNYIACLGAAQTLGCFCAEPVSDLLARGLSMPTLNLGYGGAGPGFFVRHSQLLPYVNRAAVAVVQVMSGRSEDNDLFESFGLEYLTRRSDGAKLSAEKAYRDLIDADPLRSALPPKLFTLVRTFVGPSSLRNLVHQTQSNWIVNYKSLLGSIKVPTVLLWFSRRSEWYWKRYSHPHGLFGHFPHLVTPSMIRAIRGDADDYVTCISDRGLPQPLYSRFTGETTSIDVSKDRKEFSGIWTANPYYPSPEMHEDAAAALLEPCRSHLVKIGSRP